MRDWREALDFAGATLGEIASFLVKRVFLPAYLLLHSTALDVGERRSLAAKKGQADALVANGYTPWGAKMEAFFQSLANTMMQTMSQQLAQGLMQGMMGAGTPGGSALRSMGGVGQIGKMMGAGVSGWLGGMFAASNNGTGAYTAAGQVFNNPSAYTSTATASGGFWASIGSWLSSIGKSFASGADYVPHDMVAQIHQGEMIVPKKGADAIRSGALAGHQSNFNGNVNVTVQHNGFTGMSGNGNAAQQSLGMMVGEHVRQIMLQEMRPGGLLAGARP